MKSLDGARSRSKIEAPGVSVVTILVMGAYVAVCGLTSMFLGPFALPMIAVLLLLEIALVSATEAIDLRHATVPWLILLWLVTIFLAAYVGVRNYHANYAPYTYADSGRYYKDVDAATRLNTFGDAGKVDFKQGVVLDESLSVGMTVFGSTFCAAPIMGSTAEGADAGPGEKSATFVQFWAVGKDCCPSRGGFACGGARSERPVRSGVVLPEVREEELRAFAHAHKLEHNGYLMAVEAACALYELETTDAPVLMHWVESPDREILGWLTSTLLVWIISAVAWGFVVFVVWFLVDYYFDADMRMGVEEWATGRPHHDHHHAGSPDRKRGVGSGPGVSSPVSAPKLGASAAAVAAAAKEQPSAFEGLLAAIRAGNPFQNQQAPVLPGPGGPSSSAAAAAAAGAGYSGSRPASGGVSPPPRPGIRLSAAPGIRPSSRPPYGGRGSRETSPAPGRR